MTRSVLLVDDDPAVLKPLGAFLETAGYEVFPETTGQGAIERFTRQLPDVVVLDLCLPDMSGLEVLQQLRDHEAVVILLTGHGDIETAVEAMHLGAENFLTKPVDMPHLKSVVDRAYDKVRLQRAVDLYRSRSTPEAGPASLGVSPQMREIRRQVELVASGNGTSVLLTGETGTGKSFVARMIHELSDRAKEPFVDVNCGGLTATFLASELFGHEKGAFTDAKERKQGLFELADRGTIFLDEIGDLAPDLQPKLLSVLESKTFRRVGGTREISVDVRVVAATNRDPHSLVGEGGLREDLFYRLSVLPLHIPPVRERAREDILVLLEDSLAEFAADKPNGQPEIESTALEHLLAYSWPGNVREIRNALERALILARGCPKINLEHLPVEIRGATRAQTSSHESLTLSEFERRHIEEALHHHHGNRTHAARELGISRATLIKKIKIYQLDAA